MEINPAIKKWFEGRGISEENLRDMGVYSGQHRQTGDSFEVVPHPRGNIIVFPYFDGGSVVNAKYRGSDKKFYQTPGGKKVFYNRNILDDPQLMEGRAPLIIVEGEIDVLSVREAGNPFVVSVPDGAPPAIDGAADSDLIEPKHDTKYSFLLYDWDKLKKIKRVVIATDNDAPGLRLADELVRRLGRDRCSFVIYPAGQKDFNDVLLNEGAAAVAQIINEAKPYPVSGVYRFDELPPEPPLVPVSTGFRKLDEFLQPFYPAFMTVTGFASSGKSSFVNQLVAQLSILHGWKVGIASFEMRVKPFVSDTLLNSFKSMNEHRFRQRLDEAALGWLESHFVFIAPEPGDDSDEFDIDWLIERAITAAVRHGIRILVIDPWNEIEHALGRRESLTEYTGRAIRALKRYGREFGVLVIVVAHPTKSAANKAPDDVSLYDISDTAHFANKSDLGMVVARKFNESFVSEVFVRKVRYQPITGKPGSILLHYDPERRLFIE